MFGFFVLEEVFSFRITILTDIMFYELLFQIPLSSHTRVIVLNIVFLKSRLPVIVLSASLIIQVLTYSVSIPLHSL